MEKEEISYEIRECVAIMIGNKAHDEFINSGGNVISGVENLETDLGLDSLEKVELVMLVEKKFSINIPDEECSEIFLVRDLEKLVMSQLL